MGFLDSYAHDVELPGGWTREGEAERQAERTIGAFRVAKAVMLIPRRVGADAHSSELHDDKQTARRVAHREARAYLEWSGEKCPNYPPDKEARAIAATLIWGEWIEEMVGEIRAAQGRCASAAARDGIGSWARSACYRLESEARDLLAIMA